MIKRIVKLTFQPDQIDNFIKIFEESQPKILAMPGCTHLELWRAVGDSNVLFTYSYWEREEDLDHYRQSEFFKATWQRTKALFEDRAEAWSVEVVSD